jgi:PTS system mannose-specific IIB component
MAIVEVRIDDRLIHGQVSTLWVPNLNVDRILVVDDDVAADEDRKAILKFAAPPGCKVSVFDAAKAAEKLSRHIDEGIRVMIVSPGPVPLLAMVRAGYPLDSITVGNMSQTPGSRQLTNTSYVTDADIEAFVELIQSGSTVVYQPMPTSRREDISHNITKFSERN